MNSNLCLVCAALLLACAGSSIAQERFDTPEAAAQALIGAAEKHDSARISAIFGPQAKEILTSGDPAHDRVEQDAFARMGHAKCRIEISTMNSNRAVLSIGDEDWPFPVPMVRANGKWSFVVSEAPVEMRARVVGTNEQDAIEICRGYVEAQKKYVAEDHNKDGMLEYASHLMSAPGRRNGLYWEGNDTLVPAGFAHAEFDGAAKGSAKPYHGYYFRILDRQGPNAPGGEHVYAVKNKLMGGFGLVAWPAGYGVTGVHTFIVNQNGMVYQKDIAPIAGKQTTSVTSYDPDYTWKPVE